MEDPKTFTTFDIQRILGIKIDRQKDWMNRGYIEPSIQKAAGHGTKNIFSLLDLYLIKLFHHLVEVRGFSREYAQTVLQKIKDSKQYKKIEGTPRHLYYRVVWNYIAVSWGDEGVRAFTDLDEVPKLFEGIENIDILIINFRAIVDTVDNSIEE